MGVEEKLIEQADKLLENTQFTREILGDYKKDIKKITYICTGLVIALVASFITFSIMSDNQQDKYLKIINEQQKDYMAQISKQQTEFIDFLNQYDFESVSQDGEGYNYYNRDVEVSGDLNNGAENTPEDTEG